MISLYWDIGKSIVEKQGQHKWGSKIIEQVARDLNAALPNVKGFSRTNLFSMRQFYLFYSNEELVQQPGGLIQKLQIVQQPVGQLTNDSIINKVPWGHHVLIINKTNSIEEAVFYLNETIVNNWSRNVLQIQIENKLYKRKGKAQNNFAQTLPKPQSDLANETLKDPYKFDFLTLESDVQELELEKTLIDHIMHFLLELGKGFAFVGRQYPVQIGSRERRIDLLFYHTRMHCYVVIDLKMGAFEPEFAGKMNYYLSAVDDLLKTKQDNPSIGMILCKSKNEIDVEYALRDLSKPLGVSEFTFGKLPREIKRNMPTVKEFENEFKKLK